VDRSVAKRTPNFVIGNEWPLLCDHAKELSRRVTGRFIRKSQRVLEFKTRASEEYGT